MSEVWVLGRLVMDPELTITPSGAGVAALELAVEREGKRYRCLAWNLPGRQLANVVAERLRTGDVVAVRGRVQRLLGQVDVVHVLVSDVLLPEHVVSPLHSADVGAGRALSVTASNSSMSR